MFGHFDICCRTKLRDVNAQKSIPRSSAPNFGQSQREMMYDKSNNSGFRNGKTMGRGRKVTHNRFLHDDEADEDENETYNLFTTKSDKQKSWWVEMKIDEKNINFQIDTGASSSLITKSLYDKLFADKELLESDTKLKTYTGEIVKVYGQFTPQVQYENQKKMLPLLVVEGVGPALLGTNWIHKIRLNWSHIFRMQPCEEKETLNQILEKQKELFGNDLGKLRNYKATIHMRENTPIFCRARSLPFIMKDRVSKEIDRLVETDVIEPVNHSEWATPVVPVVKGDGSIRLCGDYRSTVNKNILVDSYPLPKLDDLTTVLAGGEKFSRVDLKDAYAQIELDEESRNLTTINTHRGLFRYKRLCFGIASSPAIFQRTLENLIINIPKTVCYIDDIYVTGKNDEEHLDNLSKLLECLKQNNLRVKKEKCEFLKEKVKFLGHELTKDGLRPQPEKVEAITAAPRPENVTQLKAYLGMINFYAKFLPNAASIFKPLYDLLKKDQPWKWTIEQQKAFTKSKKLLSTSPILQLYDESRPLIVTCDASAYGIGGVIAQMDGEGMERPIAFASRTLSPAEKKYAQIEKEGLAIIFTVKRFHQFLYGRQFKIVTDHKPLLGLFTDHKQLPVMASARIQRWALSLAAYDYTLIYKPGSSIPHADALSRLPRKETIANTPTPVEILNLLNHLDNFPITYREIASETNEDVVLSKVKNFVLNGWPVKNNDEELKPYFIRRNELTLDEGCLLWGCRVVVPSRYQEHFLNELHEDHIGIVRMKLLARGFVWWPNINSQLEDRVRSCSNCQQIQRAPVSAPLQPIEWTDDPWSRLHIDHLGPFMGKHYLIVVDSTSKWMDVKIVPDLTTDTTILKLREIFSVFGLPKTIVSDNGPAFISDKFQSFLHHNNVTHNLISPYHPQANGLAERGVQTFKNAMKRIQRGVLEEKIFRFLTKYRTTPHSVTGISPAELLLGRQIRTKISLVHPEAPENVQSHQQRQKLNHDLHSKFRSFDVDDRVFIKNVYGKEPSWLPGMIVRKTGPLSYNVKLLNGVVYRRHLDHIRIRTDHASDSDSFVEPTSNSESLRPHVIPMEDSTSNSESFPRVRDQHTVSPTSSAESIPRVRFQPTENGHSTTATIDQDRVASSTDHHVQPSVIVNGGTPSCTGEEIGSVEPDTDLRTSHVPPRRSGRIRKPVDKLNI